MNIDSIPFYYATVEDADTGIVSISLVDSPAVEVEFLKFNKDKQLQYYTINKQKQCLTGVIMLAETPIYRLDPNNHPYYVVYSKETIKQMAIKMLNEDNTFNHIDTEHNGVLLKQNDLELIEIYIKDSSKGINTEFTNIPDGSLIATYKVNNPDIWSKCLNGTYNGFSLTGTFNLSPISDKYKIENYITQINNKMNFSKILQRVLLKYTEVTTDDGSIWMLDGDLIEGAVPLKDGETVPDGEYTVNSSTVTIKDGTVVSIEPIEPIEAEEEPTPEPTYATTADVESLASQLSTLSATVDTLSAKLADLESKLAEPAAEPITEEYTKAVQSNLTGAARFLNTLK